MWAVLAMAKRFFSDEDKARVHVALTVHEGNVSRTARDTGIAESTVRDWKKTWERDGVPEEIAVQAAAEADDFIRDASRIRNAALTRAEALIPGSTKIAELTTLAGVLDDKIYRARAIHKPDEEAPKQIDPRAAGELLASFVGEAMRQSEERQRSVTGAENTPEQPGLPASTS